MGIYQIVCLPTGQWYVGRTNNFENRCRQHWGDLRGRRHANRRLQRLYDKHGPEAFTIRLVEEVEGSLEAAEQRWLDAHVGQPYCLNLHDSAAHGGLSRDPGVRRRHRESAKVRANRPEWRANISAKLTAHLADPANRDARRRSVRRTVATAGWRQAQAQGVARARQDPAWVAKKVRVIHENRAAGFARLRAGDVPRFRSPAGEIIEAPNVTALARTHGLDPATLNRVWRGSVRQHKGWTREML